MNCRTFIEFLLEYFSGELTSQERTRFEEHLGRCPACLNYLHQYEETVKLGKCVCSEENVVPGDVPDELIRAILAARPQLEDPKRPELE